MNIPRIINVNGIGPVADQPLAFGTNLIHYWQGEDNNHNEKSVTLAHGNAGDITRVWFKCDEKKCDLTVGIDSGASVPLFDEGTIQFTFDRYSKQWSMSASQITGWHWKNAEEWKFCSPDTVVDQVVDILGRIGHGEITDILVGGERLYMSGLVEGFMGPIAESLKNAKNTMIQGASLYTSRRECTVVPISQQHDYDNNPFGTGISPDF